MIENGYDYSKPIEVYNDNGKLLVMNGHHRLQAAKQAGITKIPVIEVHYSKYGYKTLGEVYEAMAINFGRY
jgi:filamentous hemagglutinin